MFEHAHLTMKKRRNIPVTQVALSQTIPEEVEDNPFAKSQNTEQRLEGIKTHSSP